MKHLMIALTLLGLLAGCNSAPEIARPIHDKEQESYTYAANELTQWGLNLLATMVQKHLNEAAAFHQRTQGQIIASGNAAAAVQDELQYQAMLDELQNQVLAEFDKVAKMHQGIAAANAFHKVVQHGLANANKVDIDQVVQLADAVTQAVGLDLGPLAQVIANIKAARNLPDIDLPLLTGQ
jgi:hypothetical protein